MKRRVIAVMVMAGIMAFCAPLLIIESGMSAYAATTINPSGGSGDGSLNEDVRSKEYALNLNESGRLYIDVNADAEMTISLYEENTGDRDYTTSSMDAGDEAFYYDLTAGNFTLEITKSSYGGTGSYRRL